MRQVETLPVRVQGDIISRDRPIARLWAMAPAGSRSQDTTARSNAPQHNGTHAPQDDASIVEDARAHAKNRLETAALPASPTFRVVGLHRWDGRVLEVADGTVVAELTPTDTPEAGPVVADFPLDLVDPDSGVSPGDVVYVTSRQVTGAGGLRSTTTSVRLRRLGHWTTEEVDRIAKRARLRAQHIARRIR